MKVDFSNAAEVDLEVIGDWIAEDDPVGASSFVRQLRGRCLSLSDKPNRFPIAFREGGDVVRKLVHGNYLILYRVLSDRVEIVHVVHGARDYRKLFSLE